MKNSLNTPEHGYKVRCDKVFRSKCKPFKYPRWHQIFGFLGFLFRYILEWVKKWWQGKRMFIDDFNLVPWSPMYGAPIGGIGSGTIGRGYKGEFCRYQITPGKYQQNIVFANQFIVTIRRYGETVYQKVLCCKCPDSQILKNWNWNFIGRNAWYHALYPRAWYSYSIPEYQVRLICQQVSPVIPQNYRDSSFPGAVFLWEIYNDCSDEQEIIITFTFRNGQGCVKDMAMAETKFIPFFPDGKKNRNKQVKHLEVYKTACIKQTFQNVECTYCIASHQNECTSVSVTSNFDPINDKSDIWNQLFINGQLDNNDDAMKGVDVGCAVSSKINVKGHSKGKCEFTLVWHMPVITFGGRIDYYERWYHQYFGENGAPGLAAYALKNCRKWEKSISFWQNEILNRKDLPDWYKSALFNELYFLADGGTVWIKELHESTQCVQQNFSNAHFKQFGKFAYLEGHEYRMYNTYDVHFYASFALLMLWPELQLSLQYDIARCVNVEQKELVKYCMSGELAARKAHCCVPHDIGDPEDAPWSKLNAYIIHPTQDWKDLNSKFILQVYRDFVFTQNFEYLQHMYPICKSLLEKSLRWDVDGDGIIDNSGFADQTYDAWTVTGASAYCGGLWLAALKVFIEMANILQNDCDRQNFTTIVTSGIASYQKKLWNGSYYNYDSSNNYCHNSIMADQLAGHWYLKACNITDYQIFPRNNVRSALKTIFEKNVLPFKNGTMGAINGMRPNGRKDTTSIQSEEFWTGVSYALAATMIQEGMVGEGFQVGEGTYRTCWEQFGLAFQTPEAYFDDGRFRSLGYMRPLAIWAMHYELIKRN